MTAAKQGKGAGASNKPPRKTDSKRHGKSQLHPRNRHRNPYDFARLAKSSPSLMAICGSGLTAIPASTLPIRPRSRRSIGHCCCTFMASRGGIFLQAISVRLCPDGLTISMCWPICSARPMVAYYHPVSRSGCWISALGQTASIRCWDIPAMAGTLSPRIFVRPHWRMRQRYWRPIRPSRMPSRSDSRAGKTPSSAAS